jgi:SMC interacting uncharacterized protein involved in chromosome segregation
MNDYQNSDLMAAILSLRDATADGFETVHEKLAEHDRRFDGIGTKIERLRSDMNRRFDRVDGRFDPLEGRVARLEQASLGGPPA